MGGAEDSQKLQEKIPFTRSKTPLIEVTQESGLSLEEDSNSPPSTPSKPMSLEARYEQERKNAKIKHWRESPFAVGIVTPSWEEEQSICCCNTSYCKEDIDVQGCLCCAGFVCSRIGAKRVGNMAVLSQSMEWVEQVTVDEESGEEEVKRYQRPRLHCVVGPYWPMLFFVTYPLILGVSGMTLLKAIPHKPPLLQLAWAICTVGLIVALAKTSCSDPGILYRHENPPPQDENGWRWSDQAQSYRPRGAYFDTDCAVVVEEFDHTCPWTGTAIGKNNMTPFQCFVGLIFLCLIFDILLLTRAI